MAESENKYQCVICGKWFDESDMVGEYCTDCYIAASEDDEEY